MLDNLFRLNGNPELITTHGVMPNLVAAACVKDKIFSSVISPLIFGRVNNVTFINVSFSKVRLRKTTFYQAEFRDCLFIGSELAEVEFHHCRFIDCSFWKTSFDDVYLDPSTITFNQSYKKEAANVGLSLYQNLLKNYAESHQEKFFTEADISFRKWKRYQISYDLSKNHISRPAAAKERVLSCTYELLAGFGYRPARFFVATIILFFLISFMNYIVIGDKLHVSNSTNGSVTFVDAIFYSFSVLTVLGFSSIAPVTAFAKLLSVMEALAAIGWLAMFTSILVKRFIR